MSPEAEAFANRFPVSRETLRRLGAYVDLLQHWQRTTNLVSPQTLESVWTRHIADSAQLVELAPDATRWLDLGSGAGFPGLVIALRLAECGSGSVVLVESNAKKCAFLRAAIRETGAPAELCCARIEDVASKMPTPEMVTARALGPLDKLCGYVAPLVQKGAVGLFPKGRDVQQDLTAARRCWRIEADLLPSRTDRDGRIVRITRLEPISRSR